MKRREGTFVDAWARVESNFWSVGHQKDGARIVARTVHRPPLHQKRKQRSWRTSLGR